MRLAVESLIASRYIEHMRDHTKIATCSYCGTRSILRLAGAVQHELACSSCGARLHTMKHLRTAPQPKPERPRAAQTKSYGKPKKRKRQPARRRLFDLLDDLWDEVEDIFD